MAIQHPIQIPIVRVRVSLMSVFSKKTTRVQAEALRANGCTKGVQGSRASAVISPKPRRRGVTINSVAVAHAHVAACDPALFRGAVWLYKVARGLLVLIERAERGPSVAN